MWFLNNLKNKKGEGEFEQQFENKPKTYMFFDRKRHKDLLIDKKVQKKDEESSCQRQLNYRKIH